MMFSCFINIIVHTLTGLVGPAGSGSSPRGSEGLVGSEDLVHPVTELGDTGVDGRSGGVASAASPGDDTDQSPGAILLTDQRTTRVTLQDHQRHI